MIRPTAALLFLFLLGDCNGILNLYLSTDEVQKLLGLEAELFYVRDGIINNYALNFIVPIPSKLNLIHFTWESLANRPLPYSIEVNVSNHKAIAYPELNISRTGFVPVTKQVFSCSLPCLGLANSEVNVIIGINVTVAPGNVTNLQLRRKKICLQTEPSSTGQVVVNPIPLRSNSARIFYYALTCAAVLILTSVTCVVALYMKNNKHRKTVEETSNQSYTTFLPSTIRNQTSPTPYSNFSRQLPTYSFIEDRPSSKSLPEKIKELTADRCRVCLKNVMLEGTFSRVYQGVYTTESGSNTEVLVKTVTDHASQVQISLLLQEGTSFFSLNHPNLLSILGISFEDNKAPFLLYPVQNSNNLKLFLQKCKLCSEGVAHTLTTQEVVDMALQVIEALLYLHSKRILHKDLAARNCMVSSSLKIRVTDNALSRDLFPSDYHCLGDNENRSVKWLAIESLINKTFSTQSDVWSFGVLLWELTTLAQQPYVEIDPFEMEAYLKDGYRLSQPINCPDELFAVMAYCWAMNPDERPTFLQLQVCLKEFYAQLTRYV